MAANKPTSGKVTALRYEANPKAGLIAGAGGGTLLAVIANNLPDDSFWKPVLRYVAPSVAVVVSVLWRWIQTILWRWVENEVRTYYRTHKVSKLSKKARARLLSALKNPNTSEAHRKRIQERLEKLETMMSNRDFGEIEEWIRQS